VGAAEARPAKAGEAAKRRNATASINGAARSRKWPPRYFFGCDEAFGLAPASFAAGAAAPPWSPITLFNGQMPNAGHFLQPTAIAMGHSVMMVLQREARRSSASGSGTHCASSPRWRIAGQPDCAQSVIV
jgi:hypothetical protein